MMRVQLIDGQVIEYPTGSSARLENEQLLIQEEQPDEEGSFWTQVIASFPQQEVRTYSKISSEEIIPV